MSILAEIARRLAGVERGIVAEYNEDGNRVLAIKSPEDSRNSGLVNAASAIGARRARGDEVSEAEIEALRKTGKALGYDEDAVDSFIWEGEIGASQQDAHDGKTGRR